MAATRLPGLASYQLKHIAFLTGLPTAGTKIDLLHTIGSRLKGQDALIKSQRIISVDMGIRNLAYCVIDTLAIPGEGPMRVRTWKRTDLLDKHVQDEQLEQSEVTTNTSKTMKSRKSLPPKAAFSPPVLAQTAYNITQDLLRYEPSMILIEQQRFRSGGGPAIQEWTIRVNMLEAMLWACLQTLKQSHNSSECSFPELHSVSPARVANFWTAAPELDLSVTNDALQSLSFHPSHSAKRPRKKVEKKDKVNIVRSWLAGDVTDTVLKFDGEAAKVAGAFQSKPLRRKRADHEASDAEIEKFDDLADCLLQAVAWVKWNGNARAISRLLDHDGS